MKIIKKKFILIIEMLEFNKKEIENGEAGLTRDRTSSSKKNKKIINK
jgi:hypothetical protein